MKENQQITTKIQLKQTFLLKATHHNITYVKENIMSIPTETLQLALEALNGQKESETYIYIANYLSQHPKTEKKRKRKPLQEKPEETKKRKQNEETFLTAIQKNDIRFLIKNYKNMSDNIIEEALKIKDLKLQTQQILTSELNNRNNIIVDKNIKKETDNKQEDLMCSICVNDSSKENNSEMPFISLPCDPIHKKSHDFHIECLHSFAIECRKNRKTTFHCPICKKEYNATIIMNDDEIKKIGHLGDLIHKASKGNIEAATEILNNHDFVTDDDLGIIFKNAAENNKCSVIKFFLDKMDVINKIGISTIKDVFSTSYSDALDLINVNIFYELLCNDSIINNMQFDNTLKKMFIAIVKDDLKTFKEYFSKINFDFNTEINEDHLESNKKILKLIHYFIGFSGALNIFHDCLKEKDYYHLTNTADFYVILKGTANHGCVSIVQEFLKLENRNILNNIGTQNLCIALKDAVEHGIVSIVQEVFKQENREHLTNIDKDYLGWLFRIAAENGHLNIVQEFFKLKNRDLLNIIEENYLGAAFKHAVKHGFVSIVQEFFKLENRERLNNIDEDYLGTAFKHAVKHGLVSIVQEFLNNQIVMSHIPQEDLQKALENAKTNEIKDAISNHIKK